MNFRTVLLRRGIMDDRTIAFIAGNRAERLVCEVLSHGAEGMQFLHQVPFGQRSFDF